MVWQPQFMLQALSWLWQFALRQPKQMPVVVLLSRISASGTSVVKSCVVSHPASTPVSTPVSAGPESAGGPPVSGVPPPPSLLFATLVVPPQASTPHAAANDAQATPKTRLRRAERVRM